MIVIGEIQNPRACQAFSDYLLLQKIEHKVVVDQSSQRLQILVNPEQQVKASELFEEFVNNPNQDKYLQASWQTGAVLKGGKSNLGLMAIWQSGGTLTKLITLVCLLIFAASYFGFFRSIFQQLSFQWSVSEFYRILTPAFMHLSLMHLVFNLCWWWYLGGKVEKHLGSNQLLQILLFTALISNVSQAILANTNFAGLSGVTYGLAGFVWMIGRRTQSNDLFLPNNIFIFLVGWMILGFAEVLPINMANWAHLAGLLTGIGIALLATKKDNNKKATD
ncbi:MAG: rhomboid family intramembrane serine protease GlpG [Gammaproteobacteria bacterium]|nr:rhomboid family intramembrane serine protease GlpG [Gammaproteobacteria bacterium]